MTEDPQDRLINANSKVLVFEAERGNQGAVVATMFRLKASIKTLDQNVCRLLNAIEGLDKKLLWFTRAIFFLAFVQVGLAVYQIFFQKP